jgi:hypothetical protein
MSPLHRRRMLCMLPALCAMASVHAADAPPALLTQVRQRLADAPVLRGEFVQRKQLKGFRNPLVSRGDFLVARDRGVVWRTREPFASALVVTRDRLLSRQADGSVGTQVDAGREPGIRAINEMLFALMSTDLPVLSQRFRIEGQLSGAEGWRLALVPRDAALGQWLSRIELDGDRFVRAVRLQEAQGDTSTITLSAHAVAAVLSPDDAARFD